MALSKSKLSARILAPLVLLFLFLSSLFAILPMVVAAGSITLSVISPSVPAEGLAFSGQIATFTDSDGNTSPSMYTATISWGDGSTSSGTVVLGGSNFVVSAGPHTYTEEGSYSSCITITDQDGSSAKKCTLSDSIEDASLRSTGMTFAATEGVPFSGVVTTFTDSNSFAAVSDFSATISWGDGSSSSAGVVTGSGSPFSVSASHTYHSAGSFTVTVQIVDDGGSHNTFLSRATVSPSFVVPEFPLGSLLALAMPMAALSLYLVGRKKN